MTSFIFIIPLDILYLSIGLNFKGFKKWRPFYRKSHSRLRIKDVGVANGLLLVPLAGGGCCCCCLLLLSSSRLSPSGNFPPLYFVQHQKRERKNSAKNWTQKNVFSWRRHENLLKWTHLFHTLCWYFIWQCENWWWLMNFTFIIYSHPVLKYAWAGGGRIPADVGDMKAWFLPGGYAPKRPG